MPVTAVDRIGSLVTNDPTLGSGPLGVVENVAILIEAGRIIAVEPQGASADKRIDAEGMTVLPGFVDSHTHLVFAGERAEEFSARMAGVPYDGGGIRTTTDATRSAEPEKLRIATAKRVKEAHSAGITTIEIKSGYGLDIPTERTSLQVASGFTEHTTFLGAHVVPREFEDRPDAYVDLVTGPMLAAAAPHSRWIDAFCEKGAFDADQCRAVLQAGAGVGLGLRLHGNQLGYGPGVQLAVELGAASVDHCTYLTDADVAALGSSHTVATFLPIADFSTRQPYPDARRVIDAGATVALATNCNPGSSYSSAIGLCIALAVRDMGMTIEEAIGAATLGGAAALRLDDVGWIGVGSRADLIVLDAPSYHHLAYRPGMPLVTKTLVGGKEV